MNDVSKKTMGSNISYFEIYTRATKIQIHRLIAWGYNDAYSLIKADSDEPSITGFITEAIYERLRQSDCPKWCQYYFVTEEQPVPTANVSGKRRPRTDIIIEMSRFRGRPQFIFEAKRLNHNGYGVDKYIGNDGLGRFLSGKYASRYSEAAMLGYVQSGSLSQWQNAIKNAISSDANILFLLAAQSDVEIIDEFPFEWVSTHDRKLVGHPIDIHHILLCCDASNPG